MRDYIYRKKATYQRRPSALILHLLAMVIVIFSGPLIFVTFFITNYMSISAQMDTQVEYYLPRTEEEIRRTAIMKVIATNLEALMMLILWVVVSGTVYQLWWNSFFDHLPYIILWSIGMVCLDIHDGIEAGQRQWSGAEDTSKIGIKPNSDNVFRIAIVIFVVEFGVSVCFKSTAYNIGLKNPVGVGIQIVVIILLVADTIKNIKKWEISDYHGN